MKKGIIIAVVIVLLISVSFMNLYKFGFDKTEEDNSVNKLEQLKSKGNDFLNKNKIDSALVCYSIISEKYNDLMTAKEKDICARAYNNEGYVYFFYYNNNLQAYTLFLKALEICESSSDSTFFPVVYLNIGNIFDTYNDEMKAISYYKTAFYSALKVKDWNTVVVAFSNLVPEVCMSEQVPLKSLIPEMTAFSSLHIPNVPMYSYSLHLYRGMKNIFSNHFSEGQLEFDNAIRSVDSHSLVERDIARMNFIKSTFYKENRQYGLALKTLKQSLLMATSHKNYDLLNAIYDEMALCNQALGEKYSADTCIIRAYEINRKHFNAQQFSTMRDIKSFYELKKKNDQMLAIREKKHIENIVFGILSVCFILFFILCLELYNRKRRQLQMMENLYQNAIHQISKDHCELKYKSSNLEDDKKKQLLDKIVDLMKNDDRIFQQNFDVEQLALLVNERPRYVSQVINELYEKNFSSLLAEYRIKEACKRLRNPETYGKMSMEGISLSLGFKSRTNFIKVFKRDTGLTPTEFYKLAQTKAKKVSKRV